MGYVILLWHSLSIPYNYFGYDNLYCVRKNQPYFAYQSLYLSVFLYPGHTKYIGGIYFLPCLYLCLSVCLSVCIVFFVKDISEAT